MDNLDGEDTKLPWWKNTFNWVCGIEKQNNRPEDEISEEERKTKEAALLSIEEEPRWKRYLNINAMILITITVFLWGFFG